MKRRQEEGEKVTSVHLQPPPFKALCCERPAGLFVDTDAEMLSVSVLHGCIAPLTYE